MNRFDQQEIDRERTKEDRIQAWQRIKEDAPGIAEVIEAFSEVFGKPKYINVQINGEMVRNTFPNERGGRRVAPHLGHHSNIIIDGLTLRERLKKHRRKSKR